MKLERPARFERATPCFVGKCSGPAELWARNWITGMRGWNRTSLFRVAAERQATWLRAYQIDERLERAIGIEPIYTAWKAGASPLGQARICKMVPQARFELARALLLRQVGVPVSISHRGNLNLAEGGRFERPNVAVKARCRRPLG